MKILEGRISRSQYWRVFTSLVVAAVLLGTFLTAFGKTLPESLVLILFFLYAIIGSGYNMVYGVRRLHDMDKSGWWFLTILIPMANAVLIVALLTRPGTKGANQFGE